MKILNLPDWEAFERQVKDLFAERDAIRERTQIYVSPLLFRGQANACWRLDTTLERYAPDYRKAGSYYRTTHGAKDQIESLTGQRWEIWTPRQHEEWLASEDAFGIFDFPAYYFMVYLRHHGFPSPLLDWSRSPYIAAFFAFRGASPSVEQVSVYAYLEYPGHAKGGSPSTPMISGRGPHVRSHRRHVVQQCEYTICTVRSGEEWRYACHEDAFSARDGYQDLLWKLNIPAGESLKALTALDRYNLNAFSLFGSEDSLMETMALRAFAFREAL
jgi:hypothetical protein